MKKIIELLTTSEKPEYRAKKKARTFGSFKRAEDKQVAERKQREHEAELALIVETARIEREQVEATKARIKAVEDEHERVIKEQNTIKRNKFVTESFSSAFKTKEKDMDSVREQAIDTYLPREFIPTVKDYPEPFKEEPALNKELAEFKVKINEHLHKVGFASSGGGGIGSLNDANDINKSSTKVDGKFLQWNDSQEKYIGADASVSTLAISKLDIDGGTDIGAAIVDADLLIIDDGAGGTNRKTAASRIKTYVADVTLTTAAQTNITSVGTLTALQIDNININLNTISSTAGTDLNITPLSGQQIVLDGTIIIDAGVVTGATSITSTAFVGDITGDVTGNADTATTVTVTDSTANTNFPIVFHNESNALLDDTGALRYNPSTGNLLVPNLTVAGTTTTVDTVTMEAANAVIFEGATADEYETTLSIVDPTADHTQYLINQDGYIPVLAAATTTAITSTPADLNILDGATVVVGEINALDLGSTAVGTAIASKAVILDSSKDYTGVRNFTTTGAFKGADGYTIGNASVAAVMTLASTGIVTFADDILIKDAGTIGNASVAAVMTLASTGIVTFVDDIILKDAATIGVTSSTSAITIASTGIVTLVDDLLLKDACTIGTATTAGAIAIAADGTVDLDTAGATVASAVIKTVGKESIWVPSSAMQPTTSNGCSTLTTVETTSGRPDMVVLDFDKDSDEFAQFSIAFPKSYNLGTITFQVFWSGIAATTDCDWQLQGVAMNDNETIDVAYGTAVVVTDNAQGAVEELLVSAESGAVTIAGTVADNDLCYFRVGRDVSGDAMAGDARLHGMKILFTTDATNDA